MSILDKLEEKYQDFIFGRNKEGEIFVNGQNTGIKLTDFEINEKELLKNKFIKK